MNFTGDRRSILTLAHELGHGLHGVLSNPLGLFNADTPLTTAETASVFGEALTFKRLLAREEDPRKRLNLLAGRIEDSIATVFRQIAMNRFEHARTRSAGTSGELVDRAASRSSGSTRRTTMFRRLRGHRRLRDVVELHPALHVDARLRLRVRVRLPVRARDLPPLRAGGRRDGRAVPRAAARGRLEVARRSSRRSSASTSRTPGSGRAASTRSRPSSTRPRRSPPRSGSADQSGGPGHARPLTPL